MSINKLILNYPDGDDEMTSNIQINNITGEVDVVVPYDNITTWGEYDVMKNVTINVTVCITCLQDAYIYLLIGGVVYILPLFSQSVEI